MNNNLIHNLPDKTEYKNTTSHKFKKDLMGFCKDKNIDNALEIGANHGHTTNILSYIANKVYAVDHLLENINYIIHMDYNIAYGLLCVEWENS